MAGRPAILGLVNKALGKEGSEQQDREEHQGHKVSGYAKKPKKHFSKKPSGERGSQPGKSASSSAQQQAASRPAQYTPASTDIAKPKPQPKPTKPGLTKPDVGKKKKP